MFCKHQWVKVDEFKTESVVEAAHRLNMSVKKM